MKEPSKMHVWLCLVFPGLGQAAQRRWAAAALFGISAAVCLIWILVTLGSMIFRIFHFLGNVNTVETVDLPVQRLIILLFAVIVLIIISVIDAATAYARASRQITRQKMEEAVKNIDGT